MKIRLLLVLILAAALAACSSPAPQATQPNSVGGYPAPSQGQANGYPAPSVEQEQSSSAYPEPSGEAQNISWQEAETMIMNGRAARIVQSTDLTVTLASKDGKLYNTTAPSAEQIAGLLEQCNLCKNTEFVQK